MGAMTHNPSADTMTMGRFMDSRVIPYAESHGAGYYKGTPAKLYSVMDNHLSESASTKANLWVNKEWINYQMMEGKKLVDIGMPADWHGGTGPYYGMERHAVSARIGRHTAGGNYSTDYQPAGDLRPGVSP